MKVKNINLVGLHQSLGIAAYCILIAFIMTNISNLFGILILLIFPMGFIVGMIGSIILFIKRRNLLK